jgi:hypothetical protein
MESTTKPGKRISILPKALLPIAGLVLAAGLMQTDASRATPSTDQPSFNHSGLKWVKPNRPDEQPPFFPSRARTSPPGLGFDDFDSSQVCAGCHMEIHEQWKGSAMAHAWEDPIYRALLDKASKATDGKVDNFCIGCHSPVGMVTSSIGEVKEENVPGVDCEACHSISMRTGLDNGAYVLDKSDGNVKRGPRSDAESPYHETEYSDLHTRSDFCATCHNVTHPFNGAAIERTYDEWLDSPYSEKGIECQDCHMGDAESAGEPLTQAAITGKERDRIAGHHFAGANTTLLRHQGFPEAAERSARMLRSAADMKLVNAPERINPGEVITLTYKVENVGAGHKLPTGFPEGREMWIDLRVTDASGREIFRSGAIENGQTEPDTRNFKATMGDKDGNVVEIEVWRVTRVLSDTRIPPMGYAKVDYTFQVPKGSKGPLQLNADLNYWPFSQRIADNLLGEGTIEVEVVTMNSIRDELAVENDGGPGLIPGFGLQGILGKFGFFNSEADPD